MEREELDLAKKWHLAEFDYESHGVSHSRGRTGRISDYDLD